LTLIATTAFSQSTDEQKRHEEARRTRRELIESMGVASDAAMKSFVASATKDGVYLECKNALPRPGQLVLYRGFAFRTDEGGKLLAGSKYHLDGSGLSWWDDVETKWTLQLDGWRLLGKRTAADSGVADECKYVRGDAREIREDPPEFPHAK
jgi:hypothetical protein